MDPGDVSGESLFIVGFELLLDLNCMLVLIGHLLDYVRLLNLLCVLLSLKLLPLVLLFS